MYHVNISMHLLYNKVVLVEKLQKNIESTTNMYNKSLEKIINFF